MKAILLVAHGSRREASNDEVRQLVARLKTAAAQQASEIRAAFLELADPSIPDGIQQCIDAGATEVVVLPYFLSAGRHVASDIPAEVKIKQDQHPHINISIAPYLGSAPAIDSVLMSLV
jgi:sirohydrochlorin ferrochelatase